jgi:hypothetical protein
MNKSTLIAAAAALVAFSAVAEARTSTSSEIRGYNTCVAEAKKDSNGLVVGQQYLIDKRGSNTRYYVNGTRWEDGERNDVRVACETSARGHKLVSTTIADGNFTTHEPRVRIDVAKN